MHIIYNSFSSRLLKSKNQIVPSVSSGCLPRLYYLFMFSIGLFKGMLNRHEPPALWAKYLNANKLDYYKCSF